jgi:hypothetical protein
VRNLPPFFRPFFLDKQFFFCILFKQTAFREGVIFQVLQHQHWPEETGQRKRVLMGQLPL